MQYGEYEIHEFREETADGRVSGVAVKNVRDFDPVHTFECGQCFRWNSEGDGSYTGIAHGRVVNVKISGSELRISNTDFNDFINIWYEYFDLGTDYSKIKKTVARDAVMARAVEYGSGIRILRQELSEVIISFIISANNNIPRIKKIIEALCIRLGNEIRYKGKSYYTFPELCCIADAGHEEVAACRGGYRTGYICNTTKMLKECGLNMDLISGLDSDSARKELLKLPGIGRKVADCILLYAGISLEVFPADVWIKRVIEELYLRRQATLKEIQEFAAGYFGKFAGYAQQYLYFFARENGI
jgi:N-glycosylase/DNA lyase